MKENFQRNDTSCWQSIYCTLELTERVCYVEEQDRDNMVEANAMDKHKISILMQN
jgi:hypothetical protein